MQHQTHSPLTAPLQSHEEATQLASLLRETLERLSQTLNMETELMKAGKMRQAVDTQVDKARLTETFLKTSERFRSNIKYYRETMPDICRDVQTLHARFCNEVTRNMTALATAKAISEGLIDEIVSAAREHEKPVGYTSIGAATHGKASVAPPLRLNRSF